jgi:glycosyltransferase involved in cell wall biosynthesis
MSSAAMPPTDRTRRFLALTPQVPNPTQQGAAIRNWNLLTHIAQRYTIDVLTFGNPGDSEGPRQRPGLPGEPWSRLITVPPPRRTPGRRLGALMLSGQPDMADRLWSPLYLGQLADLLRREPYDVIQGEGIELARYLHPIARHRPAGGGPLLVFDDHNAEYVLQQRAARNDLRRAATLLAGSYSAVQWRRLRWFEARTMALCDLTICVSEVDAAALQAIAPSRPLLVAPNGVDVAYYSPEGLPRERPRFDVIFSGSMDYRPNIDAAHWFVGEVWPLVKREQDPRRSRPLRFALIGRNPPTEITGLVRHAGVNVTGSVADDRPYFAGATVYVVPMRYGGGIRLKLLNALAMGCAVVSTSAGIEGVDVCHDEHLLIADTAEEFAVAIGRLLDDPELRARLGAAGRAYVREHFDWATIAARVLAGYDAALAMRTSAASAPRLAKPEPPPPPPEMPPTPAAPTEAEGQHP